MHIKKVWCCKEDPTGAIYCYPCGHSGCECIKLSHELDINDCINEGEYDACCKLVLPKLAKTRAEWQSSPMSQSGSKEQIDLDKNVETLHLAFVVAQEEMRTTPTKIPKSGLLMKIKPETTENCTSIECTECLWRDPVTGQCLKVELVAAPEYSRDPSVLLSSQESFVAAKNPSLPGEPIGDATEEPEFENVLVYEDADTKELDMNGDEQVYVAGITDSFKKALKSVTGGGSSNFTNVMSKLYTLQISYLQALFLHIDLLPWSGSESRKKYQAEFGFDADKYDYDSTTNGPFYAIAADGETVVVQDGMHYEKDMKELQVLSNNTELLKDLTLLTKIHKLYQEATSAAIEKFNKSNAPKDFYAYSDELKVIVKKLMEEQSVANQKALSTFVNKLLSLKVFGGQISDLFVLLFEAMADSNLSFIHLIKLSEYTRRCSKQIQSFNKALGKYEKLLSQKAKRTTIRSGDYIPAVNTTKALKLLLGDSDVFTDTRDIQVAPLAFSVLHLIFDYPLNWSRVALVAQFSKSVDIISDRKIKGRLEKALETHTQNVEDEKYHETQDDDDNEGYYVAGDGTKKRKAEEAGAAGASSSDMREEDEDDDESIDASAIEFEEDEKRARIEEDETSSEEEEEEEEGQPNLLTTDEATSPNKNADVFVKAPPLQIGSIMQVLPIEQMPIAKFNAMDIIIERYNAEVEKDQESEYLHTFLLNEQELNRVASNPQVISQIRRYFNTAYLGNGMRFTRTYWDSLVSTAIYQLGPAFVRQNMRALLEALSDDNPQKLVDIENRYPGTFSDILTSSGRNLLALHLLKRSASVLPKKIPVLSNIDVIDTANLRGPINYATWNTKKRCSNGKHVFFVPELKYEPSNIQAFGNTGNYADGDEYAMMTWLQFNGDVVNHATLMIPLSRKVPEYNAQHEPSTNPLLDHLQAEQQLDIAVRYLGGKPYSLLVLAAGTKVLNLNAQNIGMDEDSKLAFGITPELEQKYSGHSAFAFSFAEFLLAPAPSVVNSQTTTDDDNGDVNTFFVERFPNFKHKFLNPAKEATDTGLTFDMFKTNSLRFATMMDNETEDGMCKFVSVVNNNTVLMGAIQFDSFKVLSYFHKLDNDGAWQLEPYNAQDGLFYLQNNNGRVMMLRIELNKIDMLYSLDANEQWGLYAFDGYKLKFHMARELAGKRIFLQQDQNHIVLDDGNVYELQGDLLLNRQTGKYKTIMESSEPHYYDGSLYGFDATSLIAYHQNDKYDSIQFALSQFKYTI